MLEPKWYAPVHAHEHAATEEPGYIHVRGMGSTQPYHPKFIAVNVTPTNNSSRNKHDNETATTHHPLVITAALHDTSDLETDIVVS